MGKRREKCGSAMQKNVINAERKLILDLPDKTAETVSSTVRNPSAPHREVYREILWQNITDKEKDNGIYQMEWVRQ